MRMCPECGKREIGPKAIRCKACHNKLDREFYISIGICPRCKKEKLYYGEKTCIECRAVASEKYKQKYWGDPEFREKVLRTSGERAHNRFLERKEAGVCYSCGRRKAAEGHSLCQVCMIASRNRQRLDIQRCERVSYGLCYVCGEKLDREGRTCKKCAELLGRGFRKARDRRVKDHPWCSVRKEVDE